MDGQTVGVGSGLNDVEKPHVGNVVDVYLSL
jgi:hypothetical protein